MQSPKILILAVIFIFLFACTKEDSSSISRGTPNIADFNYAVKTDPNNVTGIANFPLNNDVVALGRVLFYDDLLSINGRKACASCHIQAKGFADGEILSEGFMGELTERHSMQITNIRTQNAFFWDGRASNLNKQVLMPIQNHIEMGTESIAQVVQKVEAQSYYTDLFTKAFGSAEITENKISASLEAFVSSLVSYNTKFDNIYTGTASFTDAEQRGLELFATKYNCASCHGGLNFNTEWGSISFANIGLNLVDKDSGSWGRFKVPSLRNIMVTAPYMHDGRFTSIDEVLEHYSHGIKSNSILDWRLRNQENGEALKLAITEQDKKDIISFLHTLTDHEMLTDPKFSDPFE